MVRRFSVGLASFCVALLSAATPAQAQSCGATGQPACASISGIVTKAVGGAAVGTFVYAYNGDSWGGSTQSDASTGAYTIGFLPAGSYRVFTVAGSGSDANGGLIDQMHRSTGGNVECAGCRPSTSGGTEIAVVAGEARTGISFALRTGPRIKGKVTDAAGSTSLANVNVRVLPKTGSFFFFPSSVSTDSSGNFASAGLPPGTYVVQTSNSQGYLDEIHNNLPCPGGSCQSSTGMSITFTDVTNIDFTANFLLDRGGQITGKLTSAADSAAITSGWVSIFNSTGGFVTSASPGFSGASAGVYTTSGLPAGDYYARASTFGSPSYIQQLYNGIQCLSCTVTTGTKIPVALAATTSAIDFVMQPGGSISGTVTDADGNPVSVGGQTPSVQIYSTTGAFITGTGASSTGTYTASGLATGSYIVRVFPPFGSLYISRLYKTPTSVDCFSCDVTAGSGVAVTVGANTPNIDLTLTKGGNFSGKITNKVTTAGVSGAFVSIYNAQGSFVGSGFTDSTGVYSSSGLLGGSYFAYASAGSGTLIPQVYNGIPCVSCQITSGTPIEITLGATKPSIDFALDPAGTISGLVTDTANKPITSTSGSFTQTPNIQVYGSDGFFVTSRSASTSGTYTVGGLQTGKYFVRVSGPFGTGFISRLYVQPTPVDCFNCDVTQGTPISVTAGLDTPNINLTLSLGGIVSGTVKDAATGVGIPNVGVSVSSSSGSSSFGFTNSSGVYSVGGLPTGSYTVRTSSVGSTNYVREIYAGPGNRIICLSCSSSIGTAVPVTIGSTTANIDFLLTTGGSIGGTVKDSTGAAISAFVSITDSIGNFVTGGSSGSSGFTLAGLPAGTYFARTNNSQGFIDQAYDGFTCLNCNASGGTPIALGPGASKTDVNFTLAAGGRISGKLTDTAGNILGGISGAFFNVSVFNAAGSPVANASTNSSGIYTTSAGLPTGNYYVVSNNNAGYINTLYNGLGCFNCPVTTGTPVSVTAGSTKSGIDLVLSPGGKITGKVQTPNTAGTGFDPVANAFVQVYSGTGSQLTSTSTNALGNYSLLGLPTGTYFLRTNNQLGFIDQLFAGSPCTGCDVTTGTPVSVTVNSETPAINFTLAAGGTITGTVKDAATGAGLSNVSVQAYTSAGFFVRSTNTQSNGTYALKGMETGSYFIRTFNGLGYINLLRGSPDIICGSCSITAGTAVPVTVGSTTSGIDFALNIGGTLKGRVTTTDATPSGIQGVSISVFTSTGSSVGFGFTDSSGNYTVTGLLAGDVFVKTFNNQGFIDRVYNGLECVNCTVSSGTPVTIVLGTPKDNINFALPAGGRIRGRVTDSATTPNPLQGITVDVYRSTGSFVTNGQTGVDGRFVSGTGLPAGDYVLRTRNQLGYVDKLYDGVTCLGCSVQSGKIVTLANVSGAITSAENINFALSEGGAISGTVTAATGTPLQSVSVQVYTAETGLFVSSISTNGAGKYILRGLPTGSYVTRTFNSLGYIDQLYNATPCTSCSVTGGKPVAVTVGNTTPGIDFTLTAGGRIGGTVTAATGGGPVSNVSITIFSTTGVFMGSGFTSPAGTYFSSGLPAGNYLVRTSFNSAGLINLVHGSPTDIICQSCPNTTGAAVAVTLGATTAVNFSLPAGGSITGTVREAGGATAQFNEVNVQAYTTQGAFAGGGSTNGSGVYTVSGLPTGSFVLRTSNGVGFINQQYDGQVCLGCAFSSGTPIAVTVGSVKIGVNFALTRGGRISGTVRDVANSAPIPGISVQIYSSSNTFVTSTSTDNVGRYVTRAGLPAGTYYARTGNSSGWINVIHPSNTCLNCAATVGSPITVASAQTTPDIDFSLAKGGRITGTITDAATGLPLGGAGISVFLADGTSVGGSGTNASGGYSTQGLPTGTYYVRTNNSLGYVNRLYDAVNCVRCTVSIGKPISVTAGGVTSNINFALSPGGRISGVITDAATGAPLPGATVSIVDSAGFGVTSATANAAGEFTTFGGLTSGNYYVRTRNSLGYINKLYDTFLCLQCNPITGKPVVVTAGATTSGINFALTAGGRIAGTVSGGGTGLTGAFVGVYTSGGTYLTGAETGTVGQYLTGEGLPPGSYYLVTENISGFVDQLYDANSCGFACAVTSGKAVIVSAGATISGIDFNLTAGGRITGKVTDKATGGPVANVGVYIFNSAGVLVAYSFTDGLGNYKSYGGVPTGTYFARTVYSSRTAPYIAKLYDDVNCPACSPLEGKPIAVSTGAITPDINFALETGEVISGTVTDAATLQPIAGANVRLVNGSGAFVGSGRTDEAGGYVITSAVPAGTYFARTFNGLGYVDKLYDAPGPCLACDVTRGTPITADGIGSTGGINFALTAGGQIAGTVTATAGGAAVAGSRIRLFNSSGSFLGETFTNGVGVYLSPGLPPGNYFVRTANTAGFIDELYNNAPCVPCTQSQGTAVTVVTAGLKTGIDFALDSGNVLSGYIKDQGTGSPIKGATVSVYRDSDGVLVATTDPTDANGYYRISLPLGKYQVEANPVAGFRPALAALRGPFARSTVTVETGTETTGVGFALVACAPLTVNPATLPLGAQGQLYSSTLTATGGTAPFTFSISDGNPNTGLALAASGLLAGTPVFAGTGNFTVAAIDANQCAGTRTFALTACSFFLSTTSLSTTANAGVGSVTLNASATDCPWVVSTTDSWITATSAPNGTGNATVTFTYTFNSTGAARSGTLRIGGQVFSVTQATPTSTAAFGQVDTPAPGATAIVGSLAVTGWALDDVEVKRVKISRDPVAGEPAGEVVYLGDATLVEGARPDVAAVNPTLPFKTRAGWGYLLLTNMLPNQGNGTFTLHMDAVDAEGSTARLGSRTFTGDNANSIRPFGAIDTPGQGATIAGTSYVNFGWALTPNPKRIATDGSTITVFVDGAPTGSPIYNNFRGDVAGLFPGLGNTAGAIGYKYFDTTTWTNGVHTIAWVVLDDAGQAEGIGSRYFTVNNILSSQRFAPTLASMRASAHAGPAAGPAVSAWVGFERHQPLLELSPDTQGGRFVAVGQLSRLALHFGQAGCGAVSAVQIANGERTPLPVGTTLDGSGAFFWTPGPAFLGTYELEFSVPSCSGGATTIPVTVAVLPGR